MFAGLKTSVPGEKWPALLGPLGSQMLALLHQFEKSQYLSSGEIFKYQFLQLNEIFNHSIRTVPFYSEKYEVVGFKNNRAITPDLWPQLPILSRSMVQQNMEDLLSRHLPRSHGNTTFVQTSGSTGVPIKVTGTYVTRLYFLACALRDHFWHQRNFSGKMAVIRFADKGKAEFPGSSTPNWGPATASLIDTGPLVMLNSSTDISLQAQFLIREQPDYLFSYPSNLEALAKYFIQEGLHLESLQEVRTLGETLGDGTRAACSKAWGVKLVDVYSAQEVGYIALQCPESENNFHIQAENLYVEVVDEDGQPCKENEVGRVLVTTLHNFAMPLIRYEIGDYAEVGRPCSCGRKLPVLSKIMGRKRNMLILPNGEKKWPSLGASIWAKKIPIIQQFQFVQKSLDRIEAHLVVERMLSNDEEKFFKSVLQDELRYSFSIDIKYLDTIPRSQGGKFEDFISEVA